MGRIPHRAIPPGGGDPEGDGDPDCGPGGRPPPEKRQKVDEKVEKAKKLASTVSDMRAKAGLMWCTKDIKSRNDRAVVNTALSNIARSTGMHDFYDGDVAALVQNITDEERTKALMRRNDLGIVAQRNPYASTFLRQVWGRLCGRDGTREVEIAAYSDTPCAYLDRFEAAEPYTLLDDNTWCGTLARNCVTIGVGLLEEVGKIVATLALQEYIHSLIGIRSPGTPQTIIQTSVPKPASAGRTPGNTFQLRFVEQEASNPWVTPLIGISSLMIVSGFVAGFECWRRGTLNRRAFILRTLAHTAITSTCVGGADGGPFTLRPEGHWHKLPTIGARHDPARCSNRHYRGNSTVNCYLAAPEKSAATRSGEILTAVSIHIGWNMLCGYFVSNRYALNVTHSQTKVRIADAPVTQDICTHGLLKLPNVLPTARDSYGNPTDAVTYGTCRVRWHRDEECVPKFGTRDFGSVEGFRATVFRSCSHNERAAISGRVIKALPTLAQPEHLIEAEWLKLTEKVLACFDKVTKVKKGINFEEWVGSMPRSKREMYRNIRSGIVELPVSKRPTVLYEAQCFIKREKAVKRVHDYIATSRNDSCVTMGVEGLKDPRYIQAAPPEFTYFTGRFIRRFAKNMRHAFLPKAYDRSDLAAGRHFVYTCGMTNVGIGKALGDCISMIASTLQPGERIVYLEDDQSRFDMHMGEHTFRFLYKLYDRKLPRRIARMMRRGRSHGGDSPTNFGRSRLGTRHSTAPAMQSGWSDTSAGDTAANIAMKLYIHGNGKRWVSIVCGDDSVTVIVDTDLKAIGWKGGVTMSYFRLGMEVEALTSYDPSEVGFCSGRFMAVGNTFVLVPKTGKLLSRILCDTVDRPPKRQREWIQGIANGLRQFNWDPILIAYADGIDRQVGKGDKILEENQYKIQYIGSTPVSWVESLTYYDKHYCLSERQILDICTFLRNSFTIGVPMRHSLIEMMAEKDL
jgi:hypothetical protein